MFDKSKLKYGDAAPQFVLKDINGKTVDLDRFKNSYTLVAFLRYADCPWCNLAIHRLTMEEKLLKDSHVNIIAFIQSSEKDIETAIIDKHQVLPKFPIIADPKMKIYKKYHVEASVAGGVTHMIRNIPAWVQAVYKEGYKQKTVNGSWFLAPATVLLAPGDQKVIRADYNSNLYSHEAFTNIYNAVAEHSIHG